MKKKNVINSIIGEGSSFEGIFHIDGSIQVDGKFEGDMTAKECLIIGTTGKVKTHIKSENVTIAGTIIGDITAENEVMLLETGRVLGNINAAKINMSEGVVVQGEVRVTGGQKKDIPSLITESMSSDSPVNVRTDEKTK